MSGKKAKDSAITHFDWERHDEILQIVEEWEHSQEIDFEMKMEMVRVIFMGSANKDELDQRYINMVLELFTSALNKPLQSEVKAEAS